ncbi:MAG: bifunctional UDP-N-acetylglucosamine diphosphorylase/glucosamine-1-phosphate N-acetyltransferase GlmU, partial [Cyanobacteria bacterium J06659_2]
MLAVAVLAAGKGTRMKSSLPKVVHQLGGRSLVERVIQNAAITSPTRQLVIVGYGSDVVKTELNHLHNLEFVEQTQQLGTGHAVQQVIPHLKDFEGDLLVLNGDVPLLRAETLEKLVQTHQANRNAATVLTARMPDPSGYGRVFCDEKGILSEIIEDRDCTPAQRQNPRINAGIYCFNWPQLAKVLPNLKADNDQQEYYLTDVVKLMQPVMAMDVADFNEIQGINNRKQLSAAYDILQTRIKDDWMMAGVMMLAPETITIDETVQLTADVVIEPQTHLRGNTTIGPGSRIGPGSLIEDSQLGQDVTVLHSVVSDSVIKDGTRVGPYAHLRGHADIGAGCR